MPYYSWSGIDLKGQIHKGRLFARSKEELDSLLFKQDIALLSCKQYRKRFALKRIGIAHQIRFFSQLSQMLNSGVLLPDALMVIGSQMHHAQFQSIISRISQHVYEGRSLSQAMADHIIFDSLMIKMVAVGEESGRLASCVFMLAEYLEMKADFSKKLRAALLVPAISLAFFCIIALIIFVFIVPQFVSMFASVKQELPMLTRHLLSLSSMLRSSIALIWLSIFAICFFIFNRLIKTEQGQTVWDSMLLKLPFIGSLIKESSLAYFLHALSMLQGGGVQLVPAIKIAKQTIKNKILREHINRIEHEVEAGNSLSQAMIHDPAQMFSAEIVSVVRVAEESGQMGQILARAASGLQEHVKRAISIITMLANPLLMIILGLLITFLIFAVYLPIFNLSNVIGV